MTNNYSPKNFAFICSCLLLFIVASCKKDPGTSKQSTATPKKLGFYETITNSHRVLMMSVSKVGTQATPYKLVFDTGSGGMVMDGNSVIPASMITSTGFNFTGDSTVINGITITSQKNQVVYGDDNNTLDTVYGNLAYADVTVGDANGNIVVKHMPFFLYYKAVDNQGTQFAAHAFDVLGVSSEYDIFFPNGSFITSPFNYYDPGAGLTRGFKMAALGISNFTASGTYVPALTLGLTSTDLSGSGFNLISLLNLPNEGYIPLVPGSVGLTNDNVPTEMLFDTGTSPYSIIEDPNAPANGVYTLSTNNFVAISTSTGFTYSYTVGAAQNLTLVENPSYSGTGVTIFGLDFFIDNEYLLDFTNHQLGVKTN
jgi:hypothetical protein